jgi:hypothetical protein
VPFSGTTVARSSALAGSILPTVLLIGVCALFVAAALRFKVRP